MEWQQGPGNNQTPQSNILITQNSIVTSYAVCLAARLVGELDGHTVTNHTGCGSTYLDCYDL